MMTSLLVTSSLRVLGYSVHIGESNADVVSRKRGRRTSDCETMASYSANVVSWQHRRHHSYKTCSACVPTAIASFIVYSKNKVDCCVITARAGTHASISGSSACWLVQGRVRKLTHHERRNTNAQIRYEHFRLRTGHAEIRVWIFRRFGTR